MSTPAGILVPRAHITSCGEVRIDLDQRVHRFLRDHLVGGRPLLSTVMGIEAIACAVSHVRPGARIDVITDVRVGPPYLLPIDQTGMVEVTTTEAMAKSGQVTLHCEVRSDAVEPHFAAVVALAEPGPSWRPVDLPRPELPTITAPGATVYGLYFHGPSFRVVDAAGVDGLTAVSRLTRGLPPIVEPARPSITAPLLIELCLQTAGLWDLAAGNGMTIPRSIERIRRCSDVDSDASPLFAVVESGADEAGPRFDAKVMDDEGRVHLTVDGYRSTAFGHPYDVDAADRVRAQIGAISRVRASP